MAHQLFDYPLGANSQYYNQLHAIQASNAKEIINKSEMKDANAKRIE